MHKRKSRTQRKYKPLLEVKMNEGQTPFDLWPASDEDEPEDITAKPQRKPKRRSGCSRGHTISELSDYDRMR